MGVEIRALPDESNDLCGAGLSRPAPSELEIRALPDESNDVLGLNALSNVHVR